MKPLIVFSDVTVDGFMTGPNNNMDYMVIDQEVEDETTAMLMPVADAIVVGRKSFIDMAGFWPNAEGRLAAWMNATPKIVLTSDAGFDVGAWDNSTLAAGDGADQVRRVKETSGGALVTFGGVATVRSLVTANLVDEYWLKVNPAIVGTGGSMFSEVTGRRSLRLYSVRSLQSGVVVVKYSTQ
jgi:dihydrofolate reductase